MARLGLALAPFLILTIFSAPAACAATFAKECALWAQGAFPARLAARREATVIPVSRPTNQNRTLQCWAVSVTARFDAAAAARSGKLEKFSAKYIVYTKTRAEVVALIMAGNAKPFEVALCETCAPETVYYEQGGDLADGLQAARQFGLVREQDYPGFPDSDEALFRDLSNLVKSYGAHPGTEQEVTAKVEAILDSHLGGRPPERIEHNGRKVKPQELFAELLPEWTSEAPEDHGHELGFDPLAARTPEAISIPTHGGVHYIGFKTSDHGRLMKVLTAAMVRREPVLLHYKVVDKARTQRRGKIGFRVNGLKPVHAPADAMEHYVLAVGARFAKDGTLIELLVKNTWETESGEEPLFHWMQADYFFLISSVELSGEQ